MKSFGVSGLAWSKRRTVWPARFKTEESDMMPMGGKPITCKRPFSPRTFPGIA